MDNLSILNKGIKIVKGSVDMPKQIFSKIETKAFRSGRRQTGKFKSNRDSRWTLDPQDPQFGTKLECKLIFLKLIGQLLQFKNAPIANSQTIELLETLLKQIIVPGTYLDPLTFEVLDYEEMLEESFNPRHGYSNFHIGHKNPLLCPKHTAQNISWQKHRSNLVQGDRTIEAARKELCVIAERIKANS
jgi:hypothetical protein